MIGSRARFESSELGSDGVVQGRNEQSGAGTVRENGCGFGCCRSTIAERNGQGAGEHCAPRDSIGTWHNIRLAARASAESGQVLQVQSETATSDRIWTAPCSVHEPIPSRISFENLPPQLPRTSLFLVMRTARSIGIS